MKGIIIIACALLSFIVPYTYLVVKEYRKWLKIKAAFQAEFGPDWYSEWLEFSILGDEENWEFFIESRTNNLLKFQPAQERPEYEDSQNG